MEFSNPTFLWFFLGLPFLIIGHFISLKYTRKRALKFANFEAIAKVTQKSTIPKNLGILILRIVIISLIILSAAGTTITYDTVITNSDYILAIDTSNSMLATDFKPTRLQAAKDAALKLTNKISGSTLGIVSFAGTSEINLRPTSDLNLAQNTISNLDIKNIGGTNLGEVIITAVNLFDETDDKAIILFTDGQGNVGTSNENAINYAKENNVVIHTIAIATEEGIFEELNLSLSIDEESLSTMATETGGLYFRAKTQDNLQNAFKILIDTKPRSKSKNISIYLLLIAIILMFTEWLLLKTSYSTIP